MKAVAQPQSVFDQAHYLRHIAARGELIRRVVPELKAQLSLVTALDAGCGIGFFSEVLRECGLVVTAFDGREENVAEARHRFPGIEFRTGDVQDPSIRELGKFDLVLCFGLLYHLESPLSAIRSLNALSGKVLLLESMCLPDSEPYVLIRDEPSAEDQSLTDTAFYPSEGGLVKMCYRAGFSHVYRVSPLPDHDDFRETTQHKRRRTVLLAAKEPLHLGGLELLLEPRETDEPWERILPNSKRLSDRVRRFLAKSPSEKFASVASRFRGPLERVPIPVRLPFGAWWLARNDHVGRPIREGQFETAEYLFVERFLQPGMTMLDLGAHHGFYTLLGSKKVGGRGGVVAFEPSPRERRILLRHLRLNRCKNVVVEDLALGSHEGWGDLFLVEGHETGCNSLRPPIVDGSTRRVRVRVVRLEDWLRRSAIKQVDFIKMDVEGAELEVLRGAGSLLETRPRPTILAEVQDLRTAAWGYAAKEAIRFLLEKGYRWYEIDSGGRFVPLDVNQDSFHGNFVAIPEEVQVPSAEGPC